MAKRPGRASTRAPDLNLFVILDAPLGGSQSDALSALANGDIPAIASVITNGVPRFVGRSRNTPPSVRKVQVATNRVPFDFSGAGH